MVGKTIGKYRIEETIGGSPTSQIYKATDISNNRTVAVKVLHWHVKTPENIERFRREAKQLLPLKHKNIVSVFDFLIDDDENSLLILEYIGGQSLKEVIDREKKTLPDIALMIVREIALGLRQAHFEKIVHRDLKPENILVTGEGNLKVSDFGLARFFEMEGITKPGAVIGTPVFMSPEQIKGEPVDARSDIFSLGVIFYLLVSNRLPFDGSNKKEVFKSILSDNPYPLNEFVPNIPPEIMRIVDRCLEKEKDTRYMSIDQFLFDVDSYLSYYGMQEYEEYLKEYLRDTSVGQDQIARFVIDSTIRSGFKYYFIRDRESVVKFFKKLTDVKGLTEDEIDTIIKRRKTRGPWSNMGVYAGFTILLIIAFFLGRLTVAPLKTEPVKIAKVVVTPLETPTPKPKQTPRPVRKKTYPAKKAAKKVKASPKVAIAPIPPKPTMPPPAAGNGELKIITDPWAHVYIDGKYYGKTPMYDTVLLPAGMHRLVLKNPECNEFSDNFTVSGNEIVTKEISLAYRPSKIRINVPEGSNLYVDDQIVDLNNQRDPFEFSHGKHELRVEKVGYETFRKEIEVRGGKDITLNVKLKRLK